MDTIVLSGTGPTIRLKMASDLHVSESERVSTPAKVAVIDSRSVKTVNLSKSKITLHFAA